MAIEATVQAALNRYLDLRSLSPKQRKVCRHLQACRTEALGGQLLRCHRCGGEQRWYHACRDRHCPQCQGRATRQWAERQRDTGLPVEYYIWCSPCGIAPRPVSCSGWPSATSIGYCPR